MARGKIIVAKHLLNNSKYALLSAIEIHNKPIFPYRYEICTLLIINAWELLLKAYIYKIIKNKKIVQRDKKTDRYPNFENCLNMIFTKIGKNFLVVKKNLEAIYFYRNNIVHSYGIEYDTVIYSLLSQSIIFYKNFYEEHFQKPFIEGKHLILLPLGFKEIISPIEFLSNETNYSKAPQEIQKFIKEIIVSIRDLNKEGIEEPILGNFQISFTHTNNIKNADIIAQLDTNAPISINKAKKVKISNDKNAIPVRLETYDEEKKYQTENYPLTSRELRSKVTKKYNYKFRYKVVEKIKQYKKDQQYSFVCRGETTFKYKEELVDMIGESLPDNPRLEHLKPETNLLIDEV